MQGRWTIQGMRNYGHIVRGEGLPEIGIRVPVMPCDDAAVERAARQIYERLLLESDSSTYPPSSVPWEDASPVARGEAVQTALAAFRAAAETAEIREIYVDRNFGSWQEMPIERRGNLPEVA